MIYFVQANCEEVGKKIEEVKKEVGRYERKK